MGRGVREVEVAAGGCGREGEGEETRSQWAGGGEGGGEVETGGGEKAAEKGDFSPIGAGGAGGAGERLAGDKGGRRG